MANTANVTIAVSQAQAVAIRKLSLKYADVSIEAMGQRLFDSAIRNAFTPYAKAVKEVAGKKYDVATAIGCFATEISREDYIKAAGEESKAILAELLK